MSTINRLISFIAISILTTASFTAVAKTTTDTHTQHHQQLLESQSIVYEEINLIDTVALKAMMDINPEISRAAALYGESWDQVKLNPYNIATLELPDTMEINLEGACIPHDGRITSKYGWRRNRMHRGIDIKVYTGDTIRAAFDGKIRITRYERRGYGYYVVIRHDNGLETLYGHLSKFLVEPDQRVKAGEPIALGGNTGRSTGSHLHFEIRYLGVDFNPTAIFDFQNKEIKKDVLAFNPQLLAKKGSAAIFVNGTNYGYDTSGSAPTYYRVRKGDNLSRIAQRNGVTVSGICRLNGISRNSILRPGQQLRLR